jgi:hypothetical protein
MENPDSHSLSGKTRLILLLALALLTTWTAWSAYLLARENMEQQNSWKHHAAEIKDSRSPVWAEVEIDEALARSLPALPRPESNESSHGKVNVLLPNRRYASYGHYDAVLLAQDPARPERLVILDETAMWLPVAGSLLLTVVAALGLGWLYLTPWERDRTWSQGAWQDSEPTAPRAGAGTLLAEPIREPKGNQVFAALLGLLILLPFSLWMLTGLKAYPFEAGVQLAVALPLLGLSLRGVIKKHTRRVRFDAVGLADADLFGVRRVPWSAIKDIRLINLNKRSQELYDRTRLKDREGRRPEDNLGAWDVKADGGAVLLRLYKGMLPQEALTALIQRIQRQIREDAQGAFGQDDRKSNAPILREGERLLDLNDPADRKLIEEHEKAFSQFDQKMAAFEKSHRSVERLMQGFMLLVVFGLLAASLYLATQGMWEEALMVGGLTLFVGLLAWAVWWGTMRTPKGK